MLWRPPADAVPAGRHHSLTHAAVIFISKD